jgi:hypothetical protein
MTLVGGSTGNVFVTGGGNTSCISSWKGIGGTTNRGVLEKGTGTADTIGAPFVVMNGSPTTSSPNDGATSSA